jgi:hypothetical protein
MKEIKNLLNPVIMRDIAEIESIESKAGEKTQSKVLEMVTQAIKGREKDDVEWFCCFSYVFNEEKEISEHIMEIMIGPIWRGEFVPWVQKKVEYLCKTAIQIRNFGDGEQLFFVERIKSSADIFSVSSAIRRKLNEPDGEKAMKEEIEEAVEKLSNAFKVLDGMLDRILT